MKRRKRSLSQSGGPCRLEGDPEAARRLAHALSVDPEAELPFTHGFHAYPARMHPETARRVLEAFPADSVYDPFVGSGTTALEAVRRGARFVGVDVSRVALEVAWARTRIWTPDRSRRVEQAGHRLAARGAGAMGGPLEPPRGTSAERAWFSPHTFREIRALKALIDGEEEELRRMHTVVLSSLMVKLSKQASDSLPVMDRGFRPRPPGTTFRWFRDKCTELTRMLLRLGSDLHKRRVEVREPRFVRADARTFRPEGAFELALTSPPYPGTYDYALHHARRHPLFGDEAAYVFEHEMGSRRDSSPDRYRDDVAACLRNMLAASERLVLLIGDGPRVRSAGMVGELSAKLGARIIATASQRRRGGEEHLILVRRS
jgi:hypothetical protein